MVGDIWEICCKAWVPIRDRHGKLVKHGESFASYAQAYPVPAEGYYQTVAAILWAAKGLGL